MKRKDERGRNERTLETAGYRPRNDDSRARFRIVVRMAMISVGLPNIRIQVDVREELACVD